MDLLTRKRCTSRWEPTTTRAVRAPFAWWLVVVLVVLTISPARAARLKDIADVDVAMETQLMGYGLVVGLQGTGDSQASFFTMQAIVNMLKRMGVNVPANRARSRNTASVMVVAQVARHHRPGVTLDVTVSSLGDAKSLEGGTLLYTPLGGPDGLVYASAQGAVSVGGFSVQGANSNRRRDNYVLTARIPNGGIVQAMPALPTNAGSITVALHEPDNTTAQRVVEAINQELGASQALAVDAGTIVVQAAGADAAQSGERVGLLARIEVLDVTPDVAARVVLNERTGTIVAGENVSISAVAIAHGNLSVQIDAQPFVSQPAPFSQQDRTVQGEESQIAVDSGGSTLIPVQEAATVGALAQALNALGVTPRDMISIFQALKQAGALRAELRIL